MEFTWLVIQFKVDDRFYWECVRRREVDESQKCYARARTVLRGNEHHIVAHGEHSHLSDLLAVETKADTNFDFLFCHRPLGKFWLESDIFRGDSNKLFKKFKNFKVKIESPKKFLSKSDAFDDFVQLYG